MAIKIKTFKHRKKAKTEYTSRILQRMEVTGTNKENNVFKDGIGV